jgi:SAM-dependent methyltransferase
MTQAAAPSRPSSPLKSPRDMAEIIAMATGRSVDESLATLREEYETPGCIVAREFARRDLQPYVFTAGLERFYTESDAFIFESALWNRNRIKSRMRRWIGRYLDQLQRAHDNQPLRVLCIGDGLGFDSAHFASGGHAVTYHEVPGPQQDVARAVFTQAGCDVTILDRSTDIPLESFDVVVCLDVLEHVPDPVAFVHMLRNYLTPAGVLITHAPFYMIHPAYPTHLRSNRVHSGSLHLYTRNDFRLITGKAFWNPLVFQRTDAPDPLPTSKATQVLLRLTGLYLALGRWSVLPLLPVHAYRKFHNRWFG